MTQPTSENPTLAETLQVLLNQRISEAFVSLPGKVVRYNPEDQTANVVPLIKQNMQTIDGGEVSEDIPQLQNIPVIFQRGGGFFFSFPLKENDKVLIIFNDRSIDQYVRSTSNEPVDPLNFEAHGLNGAVCIPGFFQEYQKLSANDANSTDMMIGQADGGMKIRIKDSVINIESGNSAGKSAVLAEPLQALWSNLVTAFTTHIHNTPSGASDPTVTIPPTFDPQIISTKVKLPDN